MDHNHCLNCGAELHGKYCSNCGQAAAIHKFSISHIFSHDLAHGIFHLDRGFFYTVKEIIRRPGVAIREYIQGKRVNHYNYFAFIILLAAINHLLFTSTSFKVSDIFLAKEEKDVLELFQHYILEYQKLISLGLIPVCALSSFIIFRKAGFNYAEHLVINAYMQGGVLLINTIISLITMMLFYASGNVNMTRAVLFALTPLALVYPIRFYWQFFLPYYRNRFLLVYRSMQAYMLPQAVVIIILLIVLQMKGVIQ
jgi:hypothetical protein